MPVIVKASAGGGGRGMRIVETAEQMENAFNTAQSESEIAFGNGLFNYYSIWISDKYPILKPIVSFFPKGDKIIGIEQLDNAAKNSFYTRTEAQYFLMRIFSEENKLSKALFFSLFDLSLTATKIMALFFIISCRELRYLNISCRKMHCIHNLRSPFKK